MAGNQLNRPPLTPRYWPGWLGIGVLWSMGKLPQRAGLALSMPLSWLLPRLMKRRRKIAERNVERCFPGLGPAQHEGIVDDCFRSLARALFEFAWCWSASDKRLHKMGEIEGLEHALDVIKQGRGVLAITAHFSCLEIGARIVACSFKEAKAIYRPLNSPVLEWYQTRARNRYTQGTISKRNVGSAIRFLRKGGVLWYAPDQDFGKDQSAFVPFFGIEAATLLATHRLAKMTNCRVLPILPAYDPGTRKYSVKILPPLENFPSDDALHDLARINAIMEEQVRKNPGQYWWIHRRFKTRPEGEPPFYD
jgi:KDO2-lipid IV(A) lauroyltransferase